MIDLPPRLWRATELKPARQPRWIAKGRLPRAAVSLLVGDEGIGKSLLWVWIVAAITTGKPLPEFGIPARDPQHVLLVLTEDDWCTTVLPRLEVACADLDYISVMCSEDDGSGAPVFPRDLEVIREADPAPALIVIDGWLDTVHQGISVKDPQQARQALHPWREIATSLDTAVLLLTHTNRVATANARDKYGATGALRQKARLTLFAQRDDDGTLVVGPEKSNSTAATAASRFTIRPIPHFAPTEDHDGTVPLLSYAGDSEHTARQHIADAYAAEHTTDDDTDEATNWLREQLENGRVRATTIHNAADARGYSKDRLKKAKKRLCVESDRDNSVGQSGAWFWSLPLNHHPLHALHPLGSTQPLETLSTSQDDAERARGARGGDQRTCPCGNPLVSESSVERGLCMECRVMNGEPEQHGGAQ